MTELPTHSPLGASSAERWMECPGSMTLIRNLGLEGEESSYAAEGTCAHEFAAAALTDGKDAYEYLGQKGYGGFEVTVEMATAIQMYLDFCRSLVPKQAYSEGQEYAFMVERRVHRPEFHPAFYGTTDFALVQGSALHVVDFKYGAGLAVDATENPQLQYYALGILLELQAENPEWYDKIDAITVTIVQPRAFHEVGPIRGFTISRDTLIGWAYGTLQPAMEQASEDTEHLSAGEHCRFCPAILDCPLVKAMFDELATDKEVADMTNDEIGEALEKAPVVKMYVNRLSDEAFRRMNILGETVPGQKLVAKRSDRVWKEDAEDALVKVFGDEVYERKLKSPASVEKELPGGADLVKEYAYKPETGLTIAPVADRRSAQKAKKPAETYKDLKTKA